MTKPSIPTEPTFIKNITLLQKVGGSVAISTFFMVWVSGFGFVTDIFKPDFLTFLSWLRVIMATIGFIVSCFVGPAQIRIMLLWITDNYEIYRKIAAYKREKDKE